MDEAKKSGSQSPKASKPPVKGKAKKVAKPSKIALLEKEVVALKSSLAELKDRHLRLRAEFENFRKRKEREIARLLQYEGEEVIRRFLPVVDDLERMIQSVNGKKSKSANSLIEGINLIFEKLKKRLSELEVEPFDSVGQQFDPELHEAMMTQESDEHGEHEITQEFEKGYKFKDRVIRHARVVVNSPPEGKSK